MLDKGLIREIILGNLETIENMISNGIDLRADNHHALIYSAQYGHLNILKYFLKQGLNINASESGAMSWAIHNNHLGIVKYLLEHGSHISDFAIINGAVLGHLKIIKYLVKNGADFNLIEKSHHPTIEKWVKLEKIKRFAQKMEKNLSINHLKIKKMKI